MGLSYHVTGPLSRDSRIPQRRKTGLTASDYRLIVKKIFIFSDVGLMGRSIILPEQAILMAPVASSGLMEAGIVKV
jgi:hypothetical protein